MLQTPVTFFRPATLALVFLGLASSYSVVGDHRPFQPITDAPELSQRGKYPVGVRQLELINPVDVPQANGENLKAGERKLKLQLWYPALVKPGQKQETTYRGTFPPHLSNIYNVGSHYPVRGRAIANATPVPGKTFPLVIVSHGFNGNYTFFSYLSENLASKGYVVAAIDHGDFDTSAPRRVRFASTLLNRTRDQLFVIDALARRARLSRAINTSRVAIIGYSMGGFGAIGSAGAGLNKDGQTYKSVPGGHLDTLLHHSPDYEKLRNPNVKAVVALAPWGAQAPFRSWAPAALRQINTPLLFIVGDQDDISIYEDGVQWLFEHTLNSDRYMLVYQNARHNVGGNPAPAAAAGHFQLLEFYNEPVWRKERITAINQHFITAFLDWHLKGDQSRHTYFDVETPGAAAGQWHLNPGESAGDRYSGGRDDSSNSYWKGFQRRTALGLELYHLAPGSGRETNRSLER